MDTRLLAFLGIAALLTITPGADMAVVTRTALSRGRAAAFLTTLGIVVGVLLWAIASAAGLAAILNTSATLFTIVKLLGAGYLVWLGAQSLWQSRKGANAAHASHGKPEAAETSRPAYQGASFRQGLLTNLLNPKIGIFYTTFLPQFISPGDPVFAKSVLLALIHGIMGVIWLSAYAYVVTRAGDVLRRPSIKRWLDRVTGVVLVALGLRLAVETR